MNRLVTIKSNKYGLIVRLNSGVPFQEIKKEVERKFRDTAGFFGKTKVAISFEGRILTKEQEQQLIETISESAQIEIVCIIDHDEKRERIYKRLVEETFDKAFEKDGLFCRGTLRKNEVLESEKSVVILGDVERGATVVAKGSIIVLGTLSGKAYAGADGSKDSFIVSLSTQQPQIRIGNHFVRQDIREELKNERNYCYNIWKRRRREDDDDGKYRSGTCAAREKSSGN